MKKIIALLLAALMVMSMAACAAKTEPAAGKPASETSAAETSTTETKEEAAPAESDNVAVPGDDKVYIGVVKYLTGDQQTIGRYCTESVDMAVEEINAAGGILGKQVEAVYIDEGDATVDATVNAMSYALEDQRLSAMLFGYMTQNCIAAVDVLDNAEKPIPALFGNSGQKFSLDGIHDYAWQTRQLDGSGGVDRIYSIQDIAKEQNIDIQKVVIFSPDTSSSIEASESWRADFEACGYEIPDDCFIIHSNNDTNYVPYAAQIKALDPDVIILGGADADMSLAVVALEEAGLNEPGIIRVGNASIASNTVINNGGSAATGWYSFADWCPTLSTERSMEYTKNFEARYGYLPCNVNVAAYDQIYLLKAAMEQAGTTTDRVAIHDALNNISGLELCMGTYNSDNNRHSFLTELQLVQIDEQGIIQYVSTMHFENIKGAG